MKKFKWISTQEQWDSAIAALLLLDLPMALFDDGGDIRHTVIRDDDTCIAVIAEQSREDGRGDIVWGEIRKVYFAAGAENGGVARFGGSTISERALLSLALHAASANCTDDDGKPHTLDGVTTAHLDEPKYSAAYLSCSIEGCEWLPRKGEGSFVLRDSFDEFAEVVRITSGEWAALVPGKLPGIGCSLLREAMDDAEATIISDMARDAESIRLAKATGMDDVLRELGGRCPIHECHNGDRACGRDAYDREACAKTVQETVLAREASKPDGYHPALSFLGGARNAARIAVTPIKVVDVTPTASYADRLAKCIEMIPQVSPDALGEIEKHLAAIVEIEAGEDDVQKETS